MAKNLTYNINIKVNDSGLKGLITAMGNYNTSVGHADKSTAKLEKDLVAQAAAANKAAQGVGNAAKATAAMGQAANKASAEAEHMNEAFAGIANTRYAMYDVATSLGVVSAATLGLSVAAIKTEAEFERLFASVQRTSQTSGDQWGALKT